MIVGLARFRIAEVRDPWRANPRRDRDGKASIGCQNLFTERIGQIEFDFLDGPLETLAFQELAEFEIFGQTSAGFPKLPIRIEIQDPLGNDLDKSLLGMPADSDWRLRNPYNDKTMLNDFLGFELDPRVCKIAHEYINEPTNVSLRLF